MRDVSGSEYVFRDSLHSVNCSGLFKKVGKQLALHSPSVIFSLQHMRPLCKM